MQRIQLIGTMNCYRKLAGPGGAYTRSLVPIFSLFRNREIKETKILSTYCGIVTIVAADNGQRWTFLALMYSIFAHILKLVRVKSRVSRVKRERRSESECMGALCVHYFLPDIPS